MALNPRVYQVAWAVWAAVFAVLEIHTLVVDRDRATLSACVQAVWCNQSTRPAVIVLACWLIAHWILRPEWQGGASWREGVALVVGALAMWWELTRR